VLAQLGGNLDKTALRSDLREIFDPATLHERRLAIYRGWREMGSSEIEPLVWAVAPNEADAAARRLLFRVVPPQAVRDYDSLIRNARREWAQQELEPLPALVDALRFHPKSDTEALFAEILSAGPQVAPAWFAERLPNIQAAFPRNPDISAGVVRALKDKNQLVRAWASLARAQIGQRDGIEAARGLLSSGTAEVRRVAATAIARHGLEVDAPLLLALADDPQPAVRQVAQEGLERFDIPFSASRP